MLTPLTRDESHPNPVRCSGWLLYGGTFPFLHVPPLDQILRVRDPLFGSRSPVPYPASRRSPAAWGAGVRYLAGPQAMPLLLYRRPRVMTRVRQGAGLPRLGYAQRRAQTARIGELLLPTLVREGRIPARRSQSGRSKQKFDQTRSPACPAPESLLDCRDGHRYLSQHAPIKTPCGTAGLEGLCWGPLFWVGLCHG